MAAGGIYRKLTGKGGGGGEISSPPVSGGKGNNAAERARAAISDAREKAATHGAIGGSRVSLSARGGDNDLTLANLAGYLNNAGATLTGEGGLLVRPPEQREIMVLFESGLMLVSRNHMMDPYVLKLEAYARLRNIRVDRKIPTTMEIIREAYKRNAGFGGLSGGQATVTRMQRDILHLVREAVDLEASDIHIIVEEGRCQVEMRTNGVLRQAMEWRVEYGHDFCAACFAMADASDANYNPTEYQGARISQASADLPDRIQALRLQFNPLAYGGRYMVVRLLYRGKENEKIGDVATLGYHKEQIRLLKRMAMSPVGLGIVSGPTGSGKSTTLFHILARIMEDTRYERNVLTIEDPPERPIKGAKQMPVLNAPTPEERSRKFIQAISAALRSDPDTIMIGEIRDRESAKLAVEAAMTGHQVWTTVHANDALMIINRLRDIGVHEYNLFTPGLVIGLLAQRLVRVLCPDCRQHALEALRLGELDTDLWERVCGRLDENQRDQVYLPGPGCEKCDTGKGYIGRSVVAEVIVPDDRFMSLLRANDRMGARSYWLQNLSGMSMLDHALTKLATGVISPGEIERVVGPIE